jgi:AraC family transcriptional regulator
MQWIERLNEALLYIEDNLEGIFPMRKQSIGNAQPTTQGCSLVAEFAGRVHPPQKTPKAALPSAGESLDVAFCMDTTHLPPSTCVQASMAWHISGQEEGTPLKAFPRSASSDHQRRTRMEYRIERKKLSGSGFNVKLEKDMEQNMRSPSILGQERTGGTLPDSVPSEAWQVCSGCAPMAMRRSTGCTPSVAMEEGTPEGLESQWWMHLWASSPVASHAQSIQEVERRIITDWLQSSVMSSEPEWIGSYLDKINQQSFEVRMPIKKQG